MELEVHFKRTGEMGGYRYVVIATRHREQWIFCRHQLRDTWEIPGGHIEPGETPLEAAKRELFEETGAVDFTLSPVADYSVCREGDSSNGQLFFAEVNSLGALPESEIAEISFQDAMPGNLTYPQIQPFLYRQVQAWLAR